MSADVLDILTVPEVAKVLRIGRTEAYAMVGRGDIPVLRIGRRVIVPRKALEEWVLTNTARAF